MNKHPSSSPKTSPLIALLRLLCLGLAFLSAIPCVLAQQATTTPPPPPVEPVVAEPRPGSAWEIAVTYPEAATNPQPKAPAQTGPPRVRAMRSECGQDANGRKITHTTLVWSEGKPTEGYVLENFAVLLDRTTGKPKRVNLRESDYLYPHFVRGYPGTAWIGIKHYVGVEKVNEELCYKFVRPADKPPEGPGADEEPIPLPELTAWVRVVDKTPVRVVLGKAVYNYGPIKTAASTIVLPSPVQELLKKIDQQQKALELLRNRS